MSVGPLNENCSNLESLSLCCFFVSFSFTEQELEKQTAVRKQTLRRLR